MICRICGNSTDNKLFPVREMMFGTKEEFLYFACAECGCLQIKDIPKEMELYYPDRYYSFESVAPQNKNGHMLTNLRNQYAVWNRGDLGKKLYNHYPNPKLRSLLPLDLDPDAKILDVGCGSGDVLLSLSDLGFENILGVDSYIENNIHYENGLKILKGTLEKIDGKWNVIMFHHSFEHLSDPAVALQLVSSLLEDQGNCIIRIPTVSSYAWEHYKTSWVQLDAPRHFFLYSIDSMKKLALQANLLLSRIVYDSTAFQFWGSEQYLQGIPLHSNNSYAVNPAKSIFSTKEIQDFDLRSIKLNAIQQGDQAVFYFKKQNRS